MSAWSSDFSNAPKDVQLLVRHPDWECPAIVKWSEEFDASGEWLFVESALAEIDGGVAELDLIEWAAIPE